jgi:hypothetical protein
MVEIRERLTSSMPPVRHTSVTRHARSPAVHAAKRDHRRRQPTPTTARATRRVSLARRVRAGSLNGDAQHIVVVEYHPEVRPRADRQSLD